MSDILLQKIRTADNLPSLPTVAVEVLRLSRTEDASVDDLVKVIQKDPLGRSVWTLGFFVSPPEG